METTQTEIRRVTVQEAYNLLNDRIRRIENKIFDPGYQREEPSPPEPSGFEELKERLEALHKKVEQSCPDDRLSILVFSGEFDKMTSALLIATAAAASGMEVDLFFTFWGLNALKKKAKTRDKSILQKMFGMMLPRGTGQLRTSHFNMGGIGPRIFRHLMKKDNVMSLEELVDTAIDLDVNIMVCEMTRDLLGIRDEELIRDFKVAGAARYVQRASRAKVTLFI